MSRWLICFALVFLHFSWHHHYHLQPAGGFSGDSLRQWSRLPPCLKRSPSPLPRCCPYLATTSPTLACRAKSGSPSAKMSTARNTSPSSSPFWNRYSHALRQQLLPFSRQPLEGAVRVDLHCICVTPQTNIIVMIRDWASVKACSSYYFFFSYRKYFKHVILFIFSSPG